jgi:DNA-binding transcriptional LysR family regulator
MLDLTQLRSFVAVAEELHFGRAAARLNLTQSPLSRQVQMLEHTLGVRLLERTSRSVRLTPAGRTLLAEARQVLGAAEAAARITQRVARGEAGLLAVGFTSASAFRALPHLVSHIREALPELELVLEEMVTADQVEALATRRLDLGLLRRPERLSGDGFQIALVPLLREPLLLAMPQGHAMATGRQPVLQDLDGQPFVTWAPGGGSYFLDLLAMLFRSSGVTPRTVQRVNQAHTMLALVRVGIGLALVPEAARTLHVTGVVLRPIRLPDTARAELFLAWREDNDNPALPRVRALALSIFASGRREAPHKANKLDALY